MEAPNTDAAEYYLQLRPLNGAPTDFDLFLLNLLLAPPDSQEARHEDPSTSTAQNHAASSHSDTPHRDLLLNQSQSPLKSTSPTTPDKFVPEALLACPMPVLNNFMSVFCIDADLEKAIRAARRRHANRIHKRLSRARLEGCQPAANEAAHQAKTTSYTYTHEITINPSKVFADLQAAAGHIKGV